MGEHVCTKEDPWTKEKGWGQHPQAWLIDEVYDESPGHDDYEVYYCPYCKLEFRVTIPD